MNETPVKSNINCEKYRKILIYMTKQKSFQKNLKK